jgi:hypothetical protein
VPSLPRVSARSCASRPLRERIPRTLHVQCRSFLRTRLCQWLSLRMMVLITDWACTAISFVFRKACSRACRSSFARGSDNAHGRSFVLPLRQNARLQKSLILLAHPTRFERVTFAFGALLLIPPALTGDIAEARYLRTTSAWRLIAQKRAASRLRGSKIARRMTGEPVPLARADVLKHRMQRSLSFSIASVRWMRRSQALTST